MGIKKLKDRSPSQITLPRHRSEGRALIKDDECAAEGFS